MPRRRDPDAEDMLLRCPRCRGLGTVRDHDTRIEVECPTCHGAGSVSRHVYDTFLRDLP